MIAQRTNANSRRTVNVPCGGGPVLAAVPGISMPSLAQSINSRMKLEKSFRIQSTLLNRRTFCRLIWFTAVPSSAVPNPAVGRDRGCGAGSAA